MEKPTAQKCGEDVEASNGREISGRLHRAVGSVETTKRRG